MRSSEGVPWGLQDARNRYRQRHYVQVLVRRQDVARLRELAYRWGGASRPMARLEVITRLLDLARDGQRIRLVTAPPEVWSRLEELAREARLSGEELVARLVDIASHLSAEQMAAIIAPEPYEPRNRGDQAIQPGPPHTPKGPPGGERPQGGRVTRSGVRTALASACRARGQTAEAGLEP